MKCLVITLAAMALCLSLAAAPLAAKGAPDLTGTWEGTMSYVEWVNGNNNYFNSPGAMIVTNIDLATGNFYGTFDGYSMTGNVSTKKIITGVIYFGSGEYGTFDAKVTGPKISGVLNGFASGNIWTVKFDLVKQ